MRKIGPTIKDQTKDNESDISFFYVFEKILTDKNQRKKAKYEE